MTGNTIFHTEAFRIAADGRWLAPPRAVQLEGVAIDSRAPLKNLAFFAIRGERFDGHDFVPQAAQAGASIVVVERPGLEAACPPGVGVLLVADARLALRNVAAQHRLACPRTRVIAVTGSSGKTTTKRLIHAVLSASLNGVAAPKSFNNDIGVPLTLLSMRPHHDYVVVEIGMNHPGEIAALARIAQPDLGVITMIGRAHLQGMGSLDAIAREKASLLNHVRTTGHAVVNGDAAELLRQVAPSCASTSFGESPRVDVRLVDRMTNGNGQHICVQDANAGIAKFRLPLPGRHNAVNALAAITIGRLMGLDDPAIARGLADATPESMRFAQQSVGSLTLYNDAYNANPESMRAGLETFAELAANAPRRVLVLGDMLELGDHSLDLHREIGRHIRSLHQRTPFAHVVLVGPNATAIADPLRPAWPADSITLLTAADEPESVEALAAILQPGDHVYFKASRGIALERLITLLTDHAAAVHLTP